MNPSRTRFATWNATSLEDTAMPTSLVRSLSTRPAPRPQSHENAKPMRPRRVSEPEAVELAYPTVSARAADEPEALILNLATRARNP